jgi:hypothetical protein
MKIVDGGKSQHPPSRWWANKKNNVATPQALGGYSFETRSCVLDK